MRQGSAVYYFTADHLGSTSLVTDASGNEVARQKYYPFGAPRSTSGTSPTDYRFTGQRSEEAALGSLYDYGARFYSPVLGRFVQSDTIVPEPGNPQALNRYAYVLNNPLRYTDPAGHAPQSPDDDPNNPAPCATDWCWQNRWYRAHGYTWTGSGWSLLGADPHFYDEAIASDIAKEHAISFIGAWNFAMKSAVLSGVVLLSNAMGGSDKFKENTGYGLWFIYVGPNAPWMPGQAWYQPPFGLIFFAESVFDPNNDTAVTAVHEIAHRWLWDGAQAGFAAALQGQIRPTRYASTNDLEWFAEAVVVAIFGERYVAPLRQRADERPFLLGLNQAYLDYLGQYLVVNPSAILR